MRLVPEDFCAVTLAGKNPQDRNQRRAREKEVRPTAYQAQPGWPSRVVVVCQTDKQKFVVAGIRVISQTAGGKRRGTEDLLLVPSFRSSVFCLHPCKIGIFFS